jgi:hypothetical protein
MQVRKKEWAKSPKLAIAGLMACGVCCISIVAIVVAQFGTGTVAAELIIFAVMGVGGGLALVGRFLWFGRRKKQDASGSPNASCNCETKAPVACTLLPGEFKERTVWLKNLKEGALISHSIFPNYAVLRYRLGAQADVELMIRQESACCAFLQFELLRAKDHLRVTVKARDRDVDDFGVLLSHLLQTDPDALIGA